MTKLKIKKQNKKVVLELIDNEIFIKGPLGILKIKSMNSSFLINEKKFYINSKKLKSLSNEIKNIIYGVCNGWFVELNLNGIGFKCFKIDDKIALDLGYSNIVTFKNNDNIKIKNFKNRLILFGIDKSSLTNVAHSIKRCSSIDRYKGKGILFKDEKIKLKQKTMS